MNTQLTVNFHLLKNCNYRCKFCYAHFKDTNLLKAEQSKRIITELSANGISKINFAGGEPMLYKQFNDLLVYAKEKGLITSIITNGSKITKEWIFRYGYYLDILGVSCDSSSPKTLSLLGRGNGESVENTQKVFEYINEFNVKTGSKIFKKLNSVITSLNFSEDMNSFVENLKANRWKIFQILKIEGENDNYFDYLKVSPEQFESFVNRHTKLIEKNIQVVPENNSDMIESYLMINPDGRLYQNSNGKYILSESILKIGFKKAFEQIAFSRKKFIERGGKYSI